MECNSRCVLDPCEGSSESENEFVFQVHPVVEKIFQGIMVRCKPKSEVGLEGGTPTERHCDPRGLLSSTFKPFQNLQTRHVGLDTNDDVYLRHEALNGCLLETLCARLHAQKGLFRQRHTSSTTTVVPLWKPSYRSQTRRFHWLPPEEHRCTPEGHFRQGTHEHQNHEDRNCKLRQHRNECASNAHFASITTMVARMMPSLSKQR